jgi:hypothetical protein
MKLLLIAALILPLMANGASTMTVSPNSSTTPASTSKARPSQAAPSQWWTIRTRAYSTPRRISDSVHGLLVRHPTNSGL